MGGGEFCAMADIVEELLKERAEREEGKSILRLIDAYNRVSVPRASAGRGGCRMEGSLKEEVELYKSYIEELQSKYRQNRSVPRNESRYNLTLPDSQVLDVASDSDGRVLLACDDGLARVIKFGRELTSTLHIAPVLACDLWNAGPCHCSTAYLTACSSRSSIRVHVHKESDLDIDQHEENELCTHFTVGAEETHALVFLSPTLVGSGSSDGKLRVHETSGGSRVFISSDSEGVDRDLPITSLASSPGVHHQQVVAAAKHSTIAFYDYQRTHKRIGTYGAYGGVGSIAHKDALLQVEYNPRKEHELLISLGGFIRLADVRKLSQPVMEIKGRFTTAATWSPCGTMFAAGLDGRIGFWEATEPSETGRMDFVSATSPSALKWNDRYLLSLSGDSKVISYFSINFD